MGLLDAVAVSSAMTVRYDRAPSDRVVHALAGGLLTPMLRPMRSGGLPVDLQFREHDEVFLYVAQARAVAARVKATHIKVFAHPTYAAQSCAGNLFRDWKHGELGFAEALDAYLAEAELKPSPEGIVQAGWQQLKTPWVAIDREARLGFRNGAQRSDSLGDLSAAHAAVEAAIKADGKRWAKVKPPRSSNAIDGLAVSPDGALTLVELKYGGAGDLYYAPLQVLRYALQWREVLPAVMPGIRELVDAKRRLGLIPADTPDPVERLRLVVGWGTVHPSTEVLRRTRIVQEVVERHWPDEVECWCGGEDGVVRVG